MFSIWNWEPSRVAGIQFINGLGNVIGLLMASLFLMRAVPIKWIFMLGFVLLALFHFWFTFLFVLDVSLSDIIIPYVLQGVGVGLLFVPLILYTTSSVPNHLTVSSGIAGVAGRFWGSTIGFCIIQNAVVFYSKKHFFKLSQFVTAENTNSQGAMEKVASHYVSKGYSIDNANTLALKRTFSTVAKQATLLSDMEIFTFMGYSLVVLIIFIGFNQHLKHTFNLFKSKVWIS